MTDSRTHLILLYTFAVFAFALGLIAFIIVLVLITKDDRRVLAQNAVDASVAKIMNDIVDNKVYTVQISRSLPPTTAAPTIQGGLLGAAGLGAGFSIPIIGGGTIASPIVIAIARGVSAAAEAFVKTTAGGFAKDVFNYLSPAIYGGLVFLAQFMREFVVNTLLPAISANPVSTATIVAFVAAAGAFYLYTQTAKKDGKFNWVELIVNGERYIIDGNKIFKIVDQDKLEEFTQGFNEFLGLYDSNGGRKIQNFGKPIDSSAITIHALTEVDVDSVIVYD
tara:strand:- start:29117 stop:29953 length:837 start_codon:yes stop_codon:yes gene_type:complete